jgi:hypothetical protein
VSAVQGCVAAASWFEPVLGRMLLPLLLLLLPVLQGEQCDFFQWADDPGSGSKRAGGRSSRTDWGAGASTGQGGSQQQLAFGGYGAPAAAAAAGAGWNGGMGSGLNGLSYGGGGSAGGAGAGAAGGGPMGGSGTVAVWQCGSVLVEPVVPLAWLCPVLFTLTHSHVIPLCYNCHCDPTTCSTPQPHQGVAQPSSAWGWGGSVPLAAAARWLSHWALRSPPWGDVCRNMAAACWNWHWVGLVCAVSWSVCRTGECVCV